MNTPATITGAEMAKRMGVTVGQFAADLAAAGAPPSGPNRAQRRAAWRKAKKAVKR